MHFNNDELNNLRFTSLHCRFYIEFSFDISKDNIYQKIKNKFS